MLDAVEFFGSLKTLLRAIVNLYNPNHLGLRKRISSFLYSKTYKLESGDKQWA